MCSLKVVLLGAVLAMAAAGCAATVKKPSATYASQAAKPQPTEGRAAVYVIRDEWKTSGAVFEVELDRQRFGEVSSHSFLYAEVLPREHLLTTVPMKDAFKLVTIKAAASLAFTPEAGRAYYFMLSSGAFSHVLEPLEVAAGRELVGKLQLSGDSAFDEGDESVVPVASPPPAR